MPKPIKKRIDTRQHILDEDQVKNVYQRAFDYYKANKNTVIASAVVIVVVLAAALIYSLFSGSKEANFRQEEATAYQLIYDTPPPGKASVSEKERLTKAVEHYKKAIELKEDRVTLLSLGHAWFRLSEFDKAIETYDAFIKQYSDSKLIPVALQMKVKAYEQKGDKEKTIETLDALASYKNGLFKDTVFFKEAQLLEADSKKLEADGKKSEADGKKEEAIKKYEEIISAYPDSLLVGQAKAKVATLKPKPEKAETEQKGTKPEKTPEAQSQQQTPQIQVEPTDKSKQPHNGAKQSETDKTKSQEQTPQIKVEPTDKTQ